MSCALPGNINFHNKLGHSDASKACLFNNDYLIKILTKNNDMHLHLDNFLFYCTMFCCSLEEDIYIYLNLLKLAIVFVEYIVPAFRKYLNWIFNIEINKNSQFLVSKIQFYFMKQPKFCNFFGYIHKIIELHFPAFDSPFCLCGRFFCIQGLFRGGFWPPKICVTGSCPRGDGNAWNNDSCIILSLIVWGYLEKFIHTHTEIHIL